MSWGPSDDGVVKARNDLMNWLKSSGKFSEAELKKLSNKVKDIESESYSYGHEWGVLETEAGDGL